MQSVGPGTVLAGRYALERRLEVRDGASLWTARDSTLGRGVWIRVLAERHPYAPAFLDAARRSAGIDHEALARVLDAAMEDGVAYVVEEDLSQARTLADLAADGGLPGDEVRRIIGISALALEAGRSRGLHHEALSPTQVLRLPDGAVKVTGLATSASLIGLEDASPEQAARADAVGLVALTYAGLTGLWPLRQDSGGLPPAPRFVGGVAAPSEIAAGVPADLDAICRLTLVEDSGPTTPYDLARQIAPWPGEALADLPAPAEQETAEQAAAEQTTQAAAVDDTVAIAPVTRGGPERAAAAGGSPDVSGGLGVGVAVADAESAHGSDISGADADEADPTSSSDTDASVDTPSGGEPGLPDQGPTRGAAAAAAAGAAVSAAGAAVTSAADRVGALARQAAARTREAVAARTAASAPGDGSDAAGDRAVAGSVVRAEAAGSTAAIRRTPASDTELEPAVPLLDPDSIAPLSAEESKVALGIVASLLALALILGIWGVSKTFGNLNLGLAGGPETTLALPKASKTVTKSGSAVGTTAIETFKDLAFLNARVLDPYGDGAENDNAVGRIYDGSASTIWQTEGYVSANLGGKSGVGVILDLGANAAPRRVTVQQVSPSKYTLYLSTDRNLDGATQIGAGSDTGSATYAVPANAKGQYLIVWYTELAPDGSRFRAKLAEVSAQG